MSVCYLRGYLYGRYSNSAYSFRGHIREIIGDFGDVHELRPRLLGNVGIRVGEAGSPDRLCNIQLPDAKTGKE